MMVKKEKVRVQICMGTSCFVLGGADLLLHQQFLDPLLLGSCEIEQVGCLGTCYGNPGTSHLPCVRIADTIYHEVTAQKLSKLLAEVLRV